MSCWPGERFLRNPVFSYEFSVLSWSMAMTTVISERQAQAYTPGELMVVSAAREIRDGEVVFVGMRLPLIAFVVAKKTHAPNAVGLFENGVIRSTPSPELIYTMADPANIKNATQCLDMLGVMSLLQSGRVHLGFLGAAEVDRFGNLNSTEVHGAKGHDAVAGIGRRLRHRFAGPAFRSLAGAQQGAPAGAGFVCHQPGQRRRARLAAAGGLASRRSGSGDHQQGGPAFGDDGEAYLASTHPGVEVEDVLRNTGWPLRVSDEVTSTPEPNAEELKAIREYDKDGFWTK